MDIQLGKVDLNNLSTQRVSENENKIAPHLELVGDKTAEEMSKVDNLQHRENLLMEKDLDTADMKLVYDKASGLIQTIITDRISQKVIRKFPPNEYLELLTLMEKISTSAVDKNV